MSNQRLLAARVCLTCLISIVVLVPKMTGGAEPRRYFGPEMGPAEEKITFTLDEQTTVEFIETPLSDIVEYFKDLHGIPIAFDKQALKAAGVETDTPITMNLKGVSLRSVLRLILQPLKLTFTVRHEVLLITTPAAAENYDYVCVYKVDDLLEEGQSTADLADLVSELFAAEAEKPSGGKRSQVLPYGRFLVVRANMSRHEEVVSILKTLKAAVNSDAEPDPPPGVEESTKPRGPWIQRGPQTRRSRIEAHGGTEGGEAAVAAGLKWLAAHQSPDGSWSFSHTDVPCQGRCRNPGSLPDARIAATSMALLPFLGAGQSHIEGDHKRTVHAGLKFLMRSIDKSAAGANLSETGGKMYSHGLATIVFCEAYGMTRDRYLVAPAQGALDFIVHAQDPQGGGWRYMPRQPGDTSVTGWQILAISAGRRVGLEVPDGTLAAANRFLDSVQSNSGAAYGYTTPGIRETTTAIGLLCRMHLVWDQQHEALAEGVKYVAAQRATRSQSPNYYCDFFANQLVFRYTGGAGELWTRWNEKLRDHLIRSQAHDGHEAGSWHRSGDIGAERGGRLYCTALALLCLEVYYR